FRRRRTARPRGAAVGRVEHGAELTADDAVLAVRERDVVEDDVVGESGGGAAGSLLGLDGHDPERAILPGRAAVAGGDDGAKVADGPGRVVVESLHLEQVLLDRERGGLLLPGLPAVLGTQHEGGLANGPGMLRIAEVDGEDRPS